MFLQSMFLYTLALIIHSGLMLSLRLKISDHPEVRKYLKSTLLTNLGLFALVFVIEAVRQILST